ncbi:MAG: hypothetical protein AB8B88_01570 [Devosiaceae bacterium]
MRLVDAVCLIVAIGGAAYVYNVKHEAEVAHDNRRTLERQISSISQDVGLLEADLAALEQPARLQGVVSSLPEAFQLEPIASHHYIRLDDIPFRSELAALAAEINEPEEEIIEPAVAEPIAESPNQLDLLLQGLVGEAQELVTSQPIVTAVDLIETTQDSIGALLEGVMSEERP